MSENVVLVRFEEPSKTYEALSILKKCDAEDRIGLESAVIVERKPTGELRTLESWDNTGPVGLASPRRQCAGETRQTLQWPESPTPPRAPLRAQVSCTPSWPGRQEQARGPVALLR
jgi:hypothetical protein